jgi:hypothetical protein
MKPIFDTAKLHDEVVVVGENAVTQYNRLADKYNNYAKFNDDAIVEVMMESVISDIRLIEKHLLVLVRIRDVTAMSSLRDITLNEDEIDIIRLYGRDGK